MKSQSIELVLRSPPCLAHVFVTLGLGAEGCIRKGQSYYNRPKSMKLLALSLALTLGAVTLFGQESGRVAAGEAPILLAQAGRPAVAEPLPQSDPAAAEDTMRIKAPPAPGAAEGGESAPVTAMNLWNLVKSGGWAMIPLGFLSVMTGMLVLVYVFTLRRSSILTPHYMNTADVLLKKRDYLGLLAISSRHSEAVARVVQRTLDFATKNPGASYEVVKDIAETEGSSQAAALQNRTVYLADIGVLAPMIGLFGTVLGIIRAFGVLASGSIAQSRDMLLAEGVSEALVATAAGLIVGIIAMGFYSLFRNRVQSLISDLEIASAHVLGLIALNYNKKRESSRLAVEEEF
jgi:biopolymer transport protein ExbB